MKEKVLVTGGAGFIGSHLVDLLIERGYEVRVLDSLEEQVHGQTGSPPSYLNPDAAFIRGDVRDRKLLGRAMDGVTFVCHLAAAVGVAQSMHQVERYVHGNDCVTAALLQSVIERGEQVKKIVVASSMSIYGEGKYRCPQCGVVSARVRSDRQLERREWEMKCDCGGNADPVPTDEDKTPACESVYAVGKRTTEDLALVIGRAYRIPTVALRFFNTYGPRQSLSNPYTGLLAIAASRVLNKKPVVIFEDGKQLRDFIYVGDVARACLAAIEWEGRDAVAVNVGTGKPKSVLEVAEAVRAGLGGETGAEISGRFRFGDIRHCYADTRQAETVLGFKAATAFEKGLELFLDWASEEEGVRDLVDQGIRELDEKGLIK